MRGISSPRLVAASSCSNTRNVWSCLQDVLWILRKHAGSILPLSGEMPSNAVIGATPLDPKTGVRRVYHGNTVSCSFAVREPESNYAVLVLPASDSGVGSDSTKLASDGMFQDVPVAGYRLHAHVRHKESELSRRRAKDAAQRTAGPLLELLAKASDETTATSLTAPT